MWFARICLFGVLALAPSQKLQRQAVCPYCKNDPELLAAADLVGHGPMSLGESGSEALEKLLPTGQWVFLESKHLRWASSLASESIKAADRERLAAELDRLRLFFPEIPKRVKKLDPYLRIHLMAARGERFYRRFQGLLGVTDADFPASRQEQGPYMGNGPYLGEKGKFEVILHANRGTHRRFTAKTMGVDITDAVRWHLRTAHKMIVSVPAVDADLRHDRSLYPHLVHNLSHLMFCAYKHFSFDPPAWLDEGLAGAMEQEIDPEFHTLDGEEGSLPDSVGPRDWNRELKRLLRKGQLTGCASLWRLRSFGEFQPEDYVSAFGLVRFLIDTYPSEFAAFLGDIKGQLDAAGFPDGSGQIDVQRAGLKRLFGLTPARLDELWFAWIEAL